MVSAAVRTAQADLIRRWPPEALTTWKSSLTVHDYGTFYAVYADLALAQFWTDLEILPLAEHQSPLISGKKESTSGRSYVYATRASSTTSIKELSALFKSIHHGIAQEIKQIILGIVHDDSTVVYYTLNEGIAKPTVN